MRDFLRASSAEILKLKRTLALWLAVLTPLLLVTLQFALVLRVPRQRLKNGLWPMLEQGVMPWAIFMLPLLASLLTALLNGVEHREGAWRQLFALPVSRWSVYAAKLAAAHVLVAISNATLWLGLIGAGLALHWILPAVPFGPPPWLPLLKRLALVFGASSALIAIHIWVSARARSFPLPLGLGVCATLVSLVAFNDRLTRFWPWMFPVNTQVAERWTLALILGAAGGLVIALAGAWDTSRRDIL